MSEHTIWAYNAYRFRSQLDISAKKPPLPVTSLSEMGATMSRGAGTLFSFLSILLLLCSASATAQQDFGEVAFLNSGPAAAQADFLLGLAQLHNFEYEDAAEHFRKAQQIAPDFALAFWGDAMTKNHAVWHEEDVPAAREILNRLAPTPEARLAKAPTAREKLYLRSVEALFSDGTKEERHLRHESVLA